jgi:Prp8 binding protein
VTAGSSDRSVHIWDVPSGQELYYLPGHKATINEVRPATRIPAKPCWFVHGGPTRAHRLFVDEQVVFHPKEPVIASGGSDKQIYLGELA